MNHQVLLLESLTAGAEEYLEQHCLVLKPEKLSNVKDLTKGHFINAIITRGKGQVTRDLIDACGTELKIIARSGVGLDNVDVIYASQKQIKVVNAPGINAATVAEHTMTLLLMLQRKMVAQTHAVASGAWSFRNEYDGDEIRGKTLGILGMGDIGSQVARMAEIFGMQVIYWDIQQKSVHYPLKKMDDLLSDSDIITIHLPLLESTKNLISHDAFQKMKPNAIVINCARGGIVDQEALYEALSKNRIEAFGADVLSEEPPAPDEPLLALPNVLITPHSASLTRKTFDDMCMITVHNVIKALNNEDIDKRFIFNHNSIT